MIGLGNLTLRILEDFCKEPSDRRGAFFVNPQDFIFADNIRPIDNNFVDWLLSEMTPEQDAEIIYNYWKSLYGILSEKVILFVGLGS